MAASAAAQDPVEDPVATARVHLGPLALTPHMALMNVGVDNNVFNETVAPKRDFTFTAADRANGRRVEADMAKRKLIDRRAARE